MKLTLQGRYGTRTSRRDTADETSSILHIAAPIRLNGAVVGVLTVAKPTTNIRSFHAMARYRILAVGAASLMAAGLLSYLMAFWITRPIKRLTGYAKGIRDGDKPPFPQLDSSEIGEMGRAFATGGDRVHQLQLTALWIDGEGADGARFCLAEAFGFIA